MAQPNKALQLIGRRRVACEALVFPNRAGTFLFDVY